MAMFDFFSLCCLYRDQGCSSGKTSNTKVYSLQIVVLLLCWGDIIEKSLSKLHFCSLEVHSLHLKHFLPMPASCSCVSVQTFSPKMFRNN